MTPKYRRRMDYFQGRAKGTEKEKKKGTESLGKKPQKKLPQKFYIRLSGRFSHMQNAENPPVLTELLPYQGTNGLDRLPARKRKQKKRISRPDWNILSYLEKRATYSLCRQYHRRERSNFSVRNGKRWDTAVIATIISDSGIHDTQHL